LVLFGARENGAYKNVQQLFRNEFGKDNKFLFRVAKMCSLIYSQVFWNKTTPEFKSGARVSFN